MEDTIEIWEKEYSGIFERRKSRQIDNLRELAEITNSTGVHPISSFAGLSVKDYESPLDALKFSILLLAHEATECYVLGEFQSCILSCGAIIERILKLEYLVLNHQMPDNGCWTLGRCVYKLDWNGTRITEDIRELVKGILRPRNSRAHALLEHSDPGLSISGGANRGIEMIDQNKYLIEPYRGEAKSLIETTFMILAELYSGKS